MRVLILTGIQGLWQLTPAMSSSAAFSACLNNRWQSHSWSFVESFFMFSLLAATYLWDLLSPSLSTQLIVRLIPAGA